MHVSIDNWIPDIIPISGGPDEEFDEVYEAYERFYRHAKTRGGRTSLKAEAGQDFWEEVVEYFEAERSDAEAGLGMGLVMSSELDSTGLLEEKYGKEELYNLLNDSL